MTGSIWATLGTDPTNDVAEIKRAYARRLKAVHPEDDPEGFQALRAAYDQATNMARNGWAVPQQYDPDDDDAYEEVWSEVAGDRAWTRPEPQTPPESQPRADRAWTADPPLSAADLPDDIRNELEREPGLLDAHKALCDRLGVLASNPDSDRQEVLAAMLAIFRSPGMDSLQTHVQTEHWLAWLVGNGGPVTDELVEPLIQFFGWNDRPVGVDLSHAARVLQRREAASILRRLARPDDPDHAAWRAISEKPTHKKRLQERFRLGLEGRVFALLDRIDYELPQLISHTHAEAVSRWRERRHRPLLPATVLWSLLLLPFIAGAVGMISSVFGPPDPVDALAIWMLTLAVLTGLGAIWLHGVARPRQRWREDGRVWGRPAWVRLGWAPAAAVTLLVASTVPGALPWVAAWWLLLGPLVCWAIVTNAHFEESRIGLRTGFFIAMLPLAWLVIHAHGPRWITLCWVATGVTLVAHHGRPALEDAWVSLSGGRRRLVASGLAVGVVLAAAATVTAPVVNNDWSARGIAAAVLLLFLLASRPVRFTQSSMAGKVWFNWMRLGWIPCAVVAWFAPFTVASSATFAAAAAWLAGGALLTFVWEAAPRLDGLLSGQRRGTRDGY